MTQISFWGSACIKIRLNDISILCDPWFTDGVFEGSWNRIQTVDNPVQKIGHVDLIYLSHIHQPLIVNLLKILFQRILR